MPGLFEGWIVGLGGFFLMFLPECYQEFRKLNDFYRIYQVFFGFYHNLFIGFHQDFRHFLHMILNVLQLYKIWFLRLLPYIIMVGSFHRHLVVFIAVVNNFNNHFDVFKKKSCFIIILFIIIKFKCEYLSWFNQNNIVLIIN